MVKASNLTVFFEFVVDLLDKRSPNAAFLGVVKFSRLEKQWVFLAVLAVQANELILELSEFVLSGRRHISKAVEAELIANGTLPVQ
jgi:hypothetical protein